MRRATRPTPSRCAGDCSTRRWSSERASSGFWCARGSAWSISLREGGRIAGVVAEPVGTGGAAPERLAARLVVAADGRASVVAERLGLRRPHRWLRRLALVADVEGAGGDPERGEIVVVPPAYAILNPVTAGVANLSLVVPVEEGRRRKGDLAALLRHRHPLPARARRATPSGPAHRAGPGAGSPRLPRGAAARRRRRPGRRCRRVPGPLHGRGRLRGAAVGRDRGRRRGASHPRPTTSP